MNIRRSSLSANGSSAIADFSNHPGLSHGEVQVERAGTVTTATISVRARVSPDMPFRELYQVTGTGDIRQVPSYPHYQFVVTGYTGTGAIEFGVSQ